MLKFLLFSTCSLSQILKIEKLIEYQIDPLLQCL